MDTPNYAYGTAAAALDPTTIELDDTDGSPNTWLSKAITPNITGSAQLYPPFRAPAVYWGQTFKTRLSRYRSLSGERPGANHDHVPARYVQCARFSPSLLQRRDDFPAARDFRRGLECGDCRFHRARIGGPTKTRAARLFRRPFRRTRFRSAPRRTDRSLPNVLGAMDGSRRAAQAVLAAGERRPPCRGRSAGSRRGGRSAGRKAQT